MLRAVRIRIPVEDAFGRYERGEVTLIDQLSTNQDLRATSKVAGAIRVPADELPDRLAELPRDRGVVSYCT
jgi:rhodanese-related sulfurtransferase